jgi:transglutaminase/protease-like cytokinesis protein 3
MFKTLIPFVISLIMLISPLFGQVPEQFQVSEEIDQIDNTIAVVNVDKPSSQVTYTAKNTVKKDKLPELQNVTVVSSEEKGSELNNIVEEQTSEITKLGAVVNNYSIKAESTDLAANDQNNSITEEKSAEILSESNVPVAVSQDLIPGGQAVSSQVETKAKEANIPVTQDSTPKDDGRIFYTDKAGAGLIGIRYHNQSGKRMKVMIEKDSTRYTYDLKGDNSLETFPLQSGNGIYTVSILENTEGKRYRYVLKEKVNASINDANAAYLNSIQMINWNKDMTAIKKAAELTANVSRDEDKVKKIYNYVVSNIRYDYDKLANIDKLPSTYLPVIDDTLKTQLGICYDFSSLMAAMLRSSGIPTKLVMGYAEGVNGYHAWNEVYLDGKWVTIDTSYDSQMREKNLSYTMIKDSNKYKTEKEY